MTTSKSSFGPVSYGTRSVTCTDLRSADVDFLTIGQYLQPSVKHHPLDRYYKPEEFEDLEIIARSKGFLLVSSSPLTRSSYHADEDFANLKKNRINKTNAQSIS